MNRWPRSISARVAVITLVMGASIVVAAPAASAAVVSSASAGYDATCAVTSAGGVRCWGANDYGQLGNGTTTASQSPVSVVGLSSGVVAVSLGVHYACALRADGGVRCWGTGGKLGNGTTASSSVPVTPVGLASGVRSVSAGYGHACALMNDATVRCWGDNREGSLGDGTRTASLVPQAVPGLSGISQLSTGGVHTCVLTDAGGVKCWGYNAYGQVGNGTSGPTPDGDVLSPVDVVGLSGVVALTTGGYHTCVMLSEGTAECWGQNLYGELGDGTNVSRTTPVAVSAAPGAFTRLFAGAYDTCAITQAGAAMCWGADDVAQVGDGGGSNKFVPTPVIGASSGTASLAIGRAHTCRIDASGVMSCWGGNVWAQTGLQTSSIVIVTPKAIPWFVAGFTSSCSGLMCTFTDRSNDPDGDIATRTWVFGDNAGLEGNATIASHTYVAGGTYSIGLFDRSAALAQSSAVMNVTVTPWNLVASIGKVRNVSTLTLTWNAAATGVATVDVQANGAFLARTANGGSFSTTASKGTFTYRVCPTGDTRCSNQVVVKV